MRVFVFHIITFETNSSRSPPAPLLYPPPLDQSGSRTRWVVQLLTKINPAYTTASTLRIVPISANHPTKLYPLRDSVQQAWEQADVKLHFHSSFRRRLYCCAQQTGMHIEIVEALLIL
jgi:hypothetical protein